MKIQMKFIKVQTFRIDQCATLQLNVVIAEFVIDIYIFLNIETESDTCSELRSANTTCMPKSRDTMVPIPNPHVRPKIGVNMATHRAMTTMACFSPG